MSLATDILAAELEASRAMAAGLLADVPEDAMARQFGEMKNHAAWQIGHIVVSTAFAAKLVGSDYAPPAGWDDRFKPGTKPTDTRGSYPSKAELLAELDKVCAAIASNLPALDDAALAAEFPVEKFRAWWPTLGKGLAFFCVSHIAFHLGQLSGWRRAMSLPSTMP